MGWRGSQLGAGDCACYVGIGVCSRVIQTCRFLACPNRHANRGAWRRFRLFGSLRWLHESMSKEWEIVQTTRILRRVVSLESRGFCWAGATDVSNGNHVFSLLKRDKPPMTMVSCRSMLERAKNHIGSARTGSSSSESVGETLDGAEETLRVHLSGHKFWLIVVWLGIATRKLRIRFQRI